MKRWGYRGSFHDVTGLIQEVMREGDVDFNSRDLKVGNALSVHYLGVRHTVAVVPPVPDNPKGHWRYVYDESQPHSPYGPEAERYKTLSAVARVITGDRTLSGHRFFKLRRRRK